MTPFFLNPNKNYYLKELAKNIGLAHTSVKQNLNKLVRLGLILKSKEKRGKRIFPIYRADKENEKFRKSKIIHNLLSIFESNLIDYISDKLAPKSIVLFGSYSRGEDVEDSDIDFFIECKEEKLNLTKFEKKLDRKIQLHFNENFDAYPKELKNNIANGVILSGFLEVYK